jgi:4-amino-4-deoxy-L-arabinose transferase-like glycosyltransferase
VAGSPWVPLAVFVVTAVVLVPDLGGQYVWSKDEARGGLVAREMVEMGHWLIPHIGGQVYPDKPPLFHWLVALSSSRGVTEWSLRLPSLLAAAATVALTYAMGARLATPLTGFAAALILASNTTFVEWARAGRLEMLLVLWLTLAFWSALRWLDDGRRRHLVVLGLALGLGCLTKGPVGLVPLAALIVAVALLGRWSRGTLTDLGLALSVAVALPASWLGLAAGLHDGFHEYLEAVIANFVSEVQESRNRHALFAAEEIGVGFLPWTLTLPAAVFVLVRTWPTSGRVLALPLLWGGFVLVTFTVVISPRAVYFLPIYPALALVVAWAWSAASAQERRWMTWPLVLAVIAVGLAGVGLVMWPLTLEFKQQVVVLSRAVGIVLAVMAGLTALGVALLLRRRRADVVPIMVGTGALLLFVVLQVTVHTPRDNRAYPTREVAARFAAMLPPGVEVVYVDRKFTTGLMFYLRHRLLAVIPEAGLADLAHRPRRYALLPHEVRLLIHRGCSPAPPLREETLFGSRYVLVSLSDVGRGYRMSRFGELTDVPVVGDWTGTGWSKNGVFRRGAWCLDLNGNDQWDGCRVDACTRFGLPADLPVVGDWTGTGRAKIGIFREGGWALDVNGNGRWDGCGVDACLTFGLPGDVPVVGDWTGTGRTSIGVFRHGAWFLDRNGNGRWDGCGVDACIDAGVLPDRSPLDAW